LKKLVLIISIFFLFTTSVYAQTKEDIINYVNDNAQCGTDTDIFKSYNRTYTRLLKEKILTDEEIKEILNQLEISYQIVNDNNICTIRDVNDLPEKEKSTLFDALTKGANIIHQAPSITDSEKKSSEDSSLVFDRETRSIKVYDQGALIDQVQLEQTTLTYTGPSQYLLITIIVFIITLGIAIAFNILAFQHKRNKFYKRIIRDVLWGFCFTTAIILLTAILFNTQLTLYEKTKGFFSSALAIHDNPQKEIVLDENNNIIVYPAYGNRYGELLIPDLGIASPIAFGDSAAILKNNIGHHTPSAFPSEGEEIIYSGHNNTKHLQNLENIDLETQIIINASYGKFIYEVTETKIINDTDWHLLTDEDETLILYTCYPFSDYLYGKKRYVVYAELTETLWDEGDYHE